MIFSNTSTDTGSIDTVSDTNIPTPAPATI
jgi:hypothetical protein